MKIVYIIIYILCFLIGSNVTDYLGITLQEHQLCLILCCGYIIILKKNPTNNASNRHLVHLRHLFFFTSFFAIMKFLTDEREGIFFIINTIIVPPIVAFVLPVMNGLTGHKYMILRQKLFQIFIFSFILNTLLALFERLTQSNVFEAMGTSAELYINEFEFRSHGIYGHPLYNALIISTAMSFILMSSLKSKYKFILWTLGFISILCFNTRSSMIIDSGLLGIYIIHKILFSTKTPVSKKITSIIFIFIACLIIFYFFTDYNFGGRLVSSNYTFDDTSSQTRIEVFQVLYFMDKQTWLMGTTRQGYQMLKAMAHIDVTEDFWIDWLIRYGLIFLIGYVCLFYKVLKNMYLGYNIFQRLFTMITFILIASCNNSLSLNCIALVIFLFLIDLFNPRYFDHIIQHKYLE